MPQECRSDARHAYRCYLRGPDGVRELAPCGSWGNTQNVAGALRRVNRGRDPARPLAQGAFARYRRTMPPMAHESDFILDDDASIHALLSRTRRIAILGIRSEARASRPAHYVPRYLDDAGFDLFPVPVYEPDVTHILGRPVHRRISEVPRPIDLVIVFRRSGDIPAHLDDLLAARPGAVWFQSGIRNDDVASRLAAEGIRVVQDRCAMIEHGRMKR